MSERIYFDYQDEDDIRSERLEAFVEETLSGKTIIRQEMVGPYFISTVRVLDFDVESKYETMVFGSGFGRDSRDWEEYDCFIYYDEGDAKEGHLEMVKKWRAKYENILWRQFKI